MAGMSSRFFKAGYNKPKFMLEAHGKTLFEHSVESFKKYFEKEKFLFIIKNTDGIEKFVNDKSIEMGISNFYIISLENDTRGQAETVALGVGELIDKFDTINNESMTIFNIDTFRLGFTYPKIVHECDGYLEVFKGSGDNWSFAKPISDNSTRVSKTAEKKAISSLCSTGLYYFSSIDLYMEAYGSYKSRPKTSWEKGELYIAPIYNELISRNKKIHYHEIEESKVVFCGIPKEYLDFCNK